MLERPDGALVRRRKDSMASIRLNGETVHLKQQALRDFQGLAAVVFKSLKEDEAVQGTLIRILGDALNKKLEIESNIVQTTLWMLHDLGARAITIDLAESKASLDEYEETDASRGDARWLGVANIESGRAFAAALVNAHARGVLINGQPVRAFPQPREEVQKLVTQINSNRLVGEDLVFTACRAVGAMMKQGKTIADVEYRAAVEIASGLGVFELVVDFDSQKLAIREFNESSAAATALLSGADAKQVQQVRERIRGMREKLTDLRKRLAAGEKLPDGPSPPPPQRVVIPSMIGERRQIRRRR